MIDNGLSADVVAHKVKDKFDGNAPSACSIKRCINELELTGDYLKVMCTLTRSYHRK